MQCPAFNKSRKVSRCILEPLLEQNHRHRLGIAARDAFRDAFDDGAGAGLLNDCPQANCDIEADTAEVACAAPTVPITA